MKKKLSISILLTLCVLLFAVACTPSNTAIRDLYAEQGFNVQVGDIGEIELPSNGIIRSLVTSAQGEQAYAFCAHRTDALGITSFAVGICFVAESDADAALPDWTEAIGTQSAAQVKQKGSLVVLGTADAVAMIDGYKDNLLG